MASGKTPSAARGNRRFAGLRRRFVILFVGLGVIPVLAATAFVGQRAFASLEEQSVVLQHEVAAGVAGEIESVILGRAAELAQLETVSGLAGAAPDDQRVLLQNLLASQRMYQGLALIDPSGWELHRLSRDGVVLDSQLRDWAAQEPFVAAVNDKATHFGPVGFDEAAREPLMTIVHPLIDQRSAEVAAVVAATVRYKPIWNLLGEVDLEGERDVFLVSDAGQVVAHRNPALVLSGMSYTPPAADGRAFGLEGEETISASVAVVLGDQRLTVVSEQPLSIALADATNALWITAAVILVTLIAAVLLAALGARVFVKPIEDVAASAKKVAAGDFSHRIVVRTDDELGELTRTFNMMTEQLEGIVSTLEQLVTSRTADLEEAMNTQAGLIAELEAKNEAMVRIQAQLEEQIRSKDEFLGAVSHELRTPLTSVMGFAALLSSSYEVLSDKEFSEFLDCIAAEGEDMANIINDLLVAARSNAGEIVVDPQSVDVAQDIKAVVERLPGVQPTVEESELPAIVRADPTRLRQILRNLIVNADRYGGPQISIGIGQENGSLVIQVKDNGTGLPEEEWDAVFDPYWRSHHRAGQPASVGLGLTVSRMLARRMEGDLTYHHDGDHSVFELTLPAP